MEGRVKFVRVQTHYRTNKKFGQLHRCLANDFTELDLPCGPVFEPNREVLYNEIVGHEHVYPLSYGRSCCL